MNERYRILGLASARAAWFSEVARWATSAVIPAEFVKCVSPEEVRARLASGQQFSALLADASLPSLDRDLVGTASDAGCAVVVVDDGRVARDWAQLGVVASLDGGFEASALLSVLVDHARHLAGADTLPTDEATPTPVAGWRGRLVAVLGVAGSGASTCAIGIAQALAADVRYAGAVLLADLRLHGDQAVLHDTGDVVPGVQELVEAHRAGRPRSDEIRTLTHAVPDRGYEVLTGLRRHRDWAAMRERAFSAALDGLRSSYRLVVADAGCDVEGRAECGSLEVEERNLMARRVTTEADVVVVVARPTVVGLRRLATALADLLDHGVEPGALLPVLNQSPRNPAARAATSRIVAQLTATRRGRSGDQIELHPPLFLPHRGNVDDLHRDVAPLPRQLVAPLGRTVLPMVDRREQAAPADDGGADPVPITPGTIGHLTEAAS